MPFFRARVRFHVWFACREIARAGTQNKIMVSVAVHDALIHIRPYLSREIGSRTPKPTGAIRRSS